jgi:hypothetical protein
MAKFLSRKKGTGHRKGLHGVYARPRGAKKTTHSPAMKALARKKRLHASAAELEGEQLIEAGGGADGLADERSDAGAEELKQLAGAEEINEREEEEYEVRGDGGACEREQSRSPSPLLTSRSLPPEPTNKQPESDTEDEDDEQPIVAATEGGSSGKMLIARSATPSRSTSPRSTSPRESTPTLRSQRRTDRIDYSDMNNYRTLLGFKRKQVASST